MWWATPRWSRSPVVMPMTLRRRKMPTPPLAYARGGKLGRTSRPAITSSLGPGPFLQSPQRQRVAGDAEAGDGADAGRRNVGREAAARGIGDVHLDGGEADIADRGDQGGIAAGVAAGIDDSAGDALVVRSKEAIDDLAFDVGMEDLDLEAQLLGIGADLGVVFRQRHGAEDLDLGLAAHVHAGAVDHQDFHGSGVSW